MITVSENEIAKMSRAEKAQVLQWLMRDLSGDFAGIESRPNVNGGAACIVRTRIAVSMLENARRQGVTEAELLQDYPTLTAQDLANAWAYVRSHREEIEREIFENEAD